MKDHAIRLASLGLLSLGLALILAACAGPSGTAGPLGPQGPAGPQGAAGAPGKSFVVPGEGLQVKITGAEFPASGQPVISLTVTDGAGRPLSSKAIEGYGFTIAQIVVDDATHLSKYQNLLIREVKGIPYTLNGKTQQPALAQSTQPFADSGGVWAGSDNGQYTYTFSNTLTGSVDPALTTSIGVYAYKDARATVANDVYTFVLAGGQPTVTRDIVTNAACETCHNPLEAHGGVRRMTSLCVTCHTDQNIDAESGNSAEFKVMIHRIHSGANLPSVAAGTPYFIAGRSVTDFSDIVWPQDTRNCTTCHAGGADSDHYKTAPNTAACTACHDNVNLATGDNHQGGKQPDTKCAGCHEPDGPEFSASIIGGHVIPANSSSVKAITLQIVSFTNVAPDASPVVTFKVTDNTGATIVPNTMARLSANLAGPTTDYTNRWTESMTATAVEAGGGTYAYTFTAKLPKDITGTYALGLEGGVMQQINNAAVRIAAFNPVTYTAVSSSKLTPRRQIVDRNKCNACHANLAVHGTYRQNTDYCVMCHNPTASDAAGRPADAMPPTSINFRVVIHRLHSGGSAANPLVVYGGSGNPTSFSDVVFPGNLADCQTCHLPNTYGVPLAENVLPTTVTQSPDMVLSTLPTRSVCTACHDAKEAIGHTELQTTSGGIETCEVCHGAGAEFDVTKVHHP